MNICFTNKTGKSFSLGSVSLQILNENDVFDEFNENKDEASDIIFLCHGKHKCHRLATAIRAMPKEREGIRYREDLLIKIGLFTDFVETSTYLKALIK